LRSSTAILLPTSVCASRCTPPPAAPVCARQVHVHVFVIPLSSSPPMRPSPAWLLLVRESSVLASTAEPDGRGNERQRVQRVREGVHACTRRWGMLLRSVAGSGGVWHLVLILLVIVFFDQNRRRRFGMTCSRCGWRFSRFPLASHEACAIAPAFQESADAFIRNSEEIFFRISMSINQVQTSCFWRKEQLGARREMAREDLLASILANGSEWVVAFCLMDFEQARVGEDAFAAFLFADVRVVRRVMRFQVFGISYRRRVVIAGRR